MSTQRNTLPEEVIALAEEHGINIDALELTDADLENLVGGKPGPSGGQGGGGTKTTTSGWTGKPVTIPKNSFTLT